jgi:hypothetical protein
MSSRADRSDGLERMRAFVAAVMRGRPMGAVPPLALIQAGHLGPIGYRMGIRELRGEYAASAIMAGRRAAVLDEVVRGLGAHGVAVALIKGIAFAGTLYPDPAERPMHDIDLLVPRTELPDAMRAMREIGFQRIGSPRALSGYYHALDYARGDIIVELHRNMVQHRRTELRIGDVWRRAARDPSTGAVRLDPVDDLLFAVLHIARSELAVPVLNYLDVQRLCDRFGHGVPAELERRARAYRAERAVDSVLAMTGLLADGRAGRVPVRGAAILPTSDQVLLGVRPGRARQIAQKLVLTEGVREVVGLGVSWAASFVDAVRRRR